MTTSTEKVEWVVQFKSSLQRRWIPYGARKTMRDAAVRMRELKRVDRDYPQIKSKYRIVKRTVKEEVV